MPADESRVTSAPSPASAERSTRTSSSLALVLAVGAIVAPVFYFSFFPLVALLGLGGVVAVVLAILRWRRMGASRVWTVVLGTVGAIADTVIVIIALTLLIGPHLTHVELQANGGPTYTATFADDFGEHEEQWSADWFVQYTTEGSSAEITLTPTPGSTDPLSCRILWDDVVVAEESADFGQVTCHYER